MTIRSSTIPFFVLIIIITLIAVTANTHLPPELTYPPFAVEECEDDDDCDEDELMEETTLDIFIDQTLFDGSLTSINDVIYRASFGSVSLEQGLLYELRRDRLNNTRHYFNASGGFTYPLEKYKWFTPGLDWAPIAHYSSDRGGHNALSTIDIGPTAGFDAWGVPLTLRAGMSGRRVDSLAGTFTVGDYRSSVGAYGAFKVGSWEDPLPFAPIYFIADAIGRQIENSSMASLTSSALGALQVGEKDSVFIYGDVSLFNGREGYLEGTADSRVTLFTETPWRVERNASAMAGFKGSQRFIFFPSAYYGVSENRLEFLNDTRRRDEKTIRQTLSGAIATDSAAGLYYGGTLSFEWRDHDKLFGKEMATISTTENIDSLEINLWDHNAFEPRTTHRLVLKLPHSFTARYDFGLSRILTEYPNYYISGRDTITNKDDSDRRTAHHRIALEYKNDSTFKAEIFGEFINYDLVFLKQAKSSSNRTDNTQRIGLLLDWAPSNELLIGEAITIEAKRGNFHFPAFHQKALQRPRYSRAVSSSLSTIWQITQFVGINGEWNIKFSDYGFWYGREYMEEALAADPNARVDYYAITSKSVYNTVDLAVRLNIAEAALSAGNEITAARDRSYESGNYIITNENGYSIKPYFKAMIEIGGRAEAAVRLSRTIVTGNRALGYWDFRLQVEGGF